MSSLIEGYSYDVFISYRQKDNKHDGWVTDFVNNLKDELESTFKEEISVYFDINPHDGLLETHDVDESLKEKLKCLIFIPVISRTYCDPKSFAWEHEFRAFIKMASEDEFGLKIKLPNGNIGSRILPVRIYELDQEDINLCEDLTGGHLRGVEFIYKSVGVNRPLRPVEEKPFENQTKTIYRDQINKISNAIKEIIRGMRSNVEIRSGEAKKIVIIEENIRPEKKVKLPANTLKSTKEKLKSFPAYLWLISVLLIFTAVFFIGFRWYKTQEKINLARQVQLPAIGKIISEDYAFMPSPKAFKMASELEKIIPGDTALLNIWPKVSCRYNIQTMPSGADIFWKGYNELSEQWSFLGTTPLKNIKIPLGHVRIKVQKKGFDALLSEHHFWPSDSCYSLTIKIDSSGVLPKGMVRVPGNISYMIILGLEQYRGKNIGEFLSDKYEVTNSDYKHFVDSGGYSNQSFWRYPIYNEDLIIPWNEAMKLFVDKTGRQGPSTWEVGSFPDGSENYPVAGISWYEAAAYSEFAHKALPTVYHWSLLANTWNTKDILQLSNFDGISTVPVGSLDNISSNGVYDIAGNVREWCWNEGNSPDQKYILGGGFNDPTYAYNCAGTQPAIDRSPSNGFRCIKKIPGDSAFNGLTGKLELAFRDFSKEKPVDDKTFTLFLKQYSYDNSPLNAKVSSFADPGPFNCEKITVDAAYNNERFDIWLFLPKNPQPPYQPIIFFPGSNVIHGGKFRKEDVLEWMDFIVRSGRVLVFPILKGTYERSDDLTSDLGNESVFYKDHVIMWRKDIGRTIDYLQSRRDISSDKIGYFGFSWGGFMGGIIPAVETRIKVVTLMVGGMQMNKALPEVDQINFLPRVHQPILMLNGRHDMFFPVESSQKPMFNLLGSDIKAMKTYDEGHLVPRQSLIKETLNWYDLYLGGVKK